MLFINQRNEMTNETVARRIATYSGAKPVNNPVISSRLAELMHLQTKEVKALRNKKGVQQFSR